MAHNVVKKDYIFATNKVTPTDISPINIGLKLPPLRSVSNLAENKEPVYGKLSDDYASKKSDTTIAPSNNKYDYLDFTHNGTANKKEQIIKSFLFGNRKKQIIFSSVLFVVAFVAIIVVIMIVLATASKRIKKKLIEIQTLHIKFTLNPLSNDKLVFGVVEFKKNVERLIK